MVVDAAQLRVRPGQLRSEDWTVGWSTLKVFGWIE